MLWQAWTMSATYAYLGGDLEFERTIDGVRKVTLKDGCAYFLGKKKRPLLVLSHHAFGAAWRDRSDYDDRDADGVVVVVGGDRVVALPAVGGVERETDPFGDTVFHVLTAPDDEDLPVAVLSADAATLIVRQ